MFVDFGVLNVFLLFVVVVDFVAGGGELSCSFAGSFGVREGFPIVLNNNSELDSLSSVPQRKTPIPPCYHWRMQTQYLLKQVAAKAKAVNSIVPVLCVKNR